MKPLNILKFIIIAAAMLALWPQGGSRASDGGITAETPLNGILHLGRRNCPAGQARPCVAFFELHGQAARQLYDNMRTPAKADLCTEGHMKTDESGLHCFASGDGRYGCYFGYHFDRQQIVEGAFSC